MAQLLYRFEERTGKTTVCFLHPAYASYKALSLPASSEQGQGQVERWLMYWAVLGSWTAVESVIGWGFTWIPFYNIIKTTIFVGLALPSSGGAAYIYHTHLAPFFHQYEGDVDAFLASLKGRASTALTEGLGWVWERAKEQLNGALPPQGFQVGTPGQPPAYSSLGNAQYPSDPTQPPTLQDPASGAVQQLYRSVTHYAGRQVFFFISPTRHPLSPCSIQTIYSCKPPYTVHNTFLYMPLAISALSAAAASTRNPIQPPVRATQVPESVDMPIPIPTPPVRTDSSSSAELRSRTYQMASQLNQAISSSRISSQPRAMSASLPVDRPPSQNSSAESLASRSSAKWVESYEHVAMDEAREAEGQRPGVGRRSSSWWGWTGSPGKEKDKAE
ncbi:hypothetical protein TREMEDRAFT_60618 [Tremella mesenterica DSM 1558]|uniref:uncharacterized protein n=1 Tax=Tremella mesenterica (strain ATCC 24925 / CBS 8224 / DSM 1558 / NBRC 9311 / NRRL Y-6157 / RJB 2259-6 / UBC 559-6) TaxID=578456 RepID=UPI0003F4924D|nr:uncharacterized protein TREMEDRAFT_60618 [Tremella mesenterica DSM 1558]EIW71698.1 hypothetical protein TREMEDRAFT_60618 [Tremella mesenterica DSM 1558]